MGYLTTRSASKLLAISMIVMMMIGMLPPLANVGAESRDNSSRVTVIDGFTAASTGLPNALEYTTVVVGNFNGDTNLDIVSGILGWVSSNSGIDIWTNNNGAQSWTKQTSTGLPTTGEYGQLGVGDINEDGVDDIVAPTETYWSGSAPLGVRVYTSDGQAVPSFTAGNHPTPTGSYQASLVHDLDKDGHMDIIATGETTGVQVWLGDGGTTWTPSNTGLPSTGYFYGISVGDLNKDGKWDIAVGSKSSGVNVYIGDGSGNWTEQSSGLPSSGEYWGTNISDFDGDGNPDIATNHYFDGGMRVYTGDGGAGGSMSFTSESSGLPTSGNYCQVYGPDLDGDGISEIWTTESYSQNGGARLYTSDGGSPIKWTRFNDNTLPSTGYWAGAAVGDLDNDGDLDLVASDSGLNAGGTVGIRAFLTDLSNVNYYPVADAGSDQIVLVGDTVNLDGTASTHTGPTGTVTGYKWNVTAQPTGSAVVLSDDTSATPSFMPRKVGQYTISLAVVDDLGIWGQIEDSIVITADAWPNEVPTAVTGPDFSGTIFDTIQLDGTASTDDSAIAAYQWRIDETPDSNLTLSDTAIANPTFVPEFIGIYKFSLKVQDDNDTWSPFKQIKVTVNPSGTGPPLSNAGLDVTIELDDTFVLDGSASTDDSSIKAYDWTVESQPPGSNLVVADVKVQNLTPSFEGVYVISLMVMDNDNLWSAMSDSMQVVVLPRNLAPEALIDAPEDAEVFLTTDTIQFDGSASSDPEGSDITFLWSSSIDGDLSTEDSFSTMLSEGDHTITLSVTDDHDHTVSSTIDIKVKLDTLPTAGLSADQTLLLKGGKVAFDATTSSDVEGVVSEYYYDFGDGLNSGWLSQPTTTHNYLKTGEFHATVTVKDNKAQESPVSAPVTITVGEAPISKLSADNTVIKVGKTVTFDASGSSDADGTIVEYKFEFSDNTDSGWITESTYNKTFETAGTFTATVMTRDNHGFESSNLAQVKVTVEKKAVGNTDTGLDGMMLPLLALIIVVVVVVVLMMVMKRKKGPSSTGPEQPEGQQPPPPPTGYEQPQGYDPSGYDQNGSSQGYDQGYGQGYDQNGSPQGYDQGYGQGYDQNGSPQGYDQGYDQNGSPQGYDQGYDQNGSSQGYDQGYGQGYDQNGSPQGYDQGYDQNGSSQGYDQGYDQSGQ